jgi:hypothetical protein
MLQEDQMRRDRNTGARREFSSFGKRAYSGVRTGRIRANHQMLKNETHSLSNNAFVGLLSTNSCLPDKRLVW